MFFQHSLYEVYQQESVRELLAKIRESSLKGMESGTRDSLGWPLAYKSD
jgi:hypothetical protein